MPRPLLFCLKSGRSVCYSVPDNNEKKEKSKVKKQVPLRLSKELYDEIAQWAEDEFRSMNGQIEYLLTECVKWRKRSGKKDE